MSYNKVRQKKANWKKEKIKISEESSKKKERNKQNYE